MPDALSAIRRVCVCKTSGRFLGHPRLTARSVGILNTSGQGAQRAARPAALALMQILKTKDLAAHGDDTGGALGVRYHQGPIASAILPQFHPLVGAAYALPDPHGPKILFEAELHVVGCGANDLGDGTGIGCCLAGQGADAQNTQEGGFEWAECHLFGSLRRGG